MTSCRPFALMRVGHAPVPTLPFHIPFESAYACTPTLSRTCAIPSYTYLEGFFHKDANHVNVQKLGHARTHAHLFARALAFSPRPFAVALCSLTTRWATDRGALADGAPLRSLRRGRKQRGALGVDICEHHPLRAEARPPDILMNALRAHNKRARPGRKHDASPPTSRLRRMRQPKQRRTGAQEVNAQRRGGGDRQLFMAKLAARSGRSTT